MKIAILMSTYNGEKYLDEQLDSIYRQIVDANITVYVRDDGSKDNTVNILKKWSTKLDIVLTEGENIGPADSFWKLFTSKNIKGDYYAFCDQDDVWDSNKLQIGVNALSGLTIESLWCSNCRIIDKDGNVLESRMNSRAPDFSLISQFVCGTTQGCAMLFNDKLRNYILKKEIEKKPMHDFVVMSYAIAKGKLIYEDEPTFSYRVHNNNVIAKKGKSFVQHFKASFIKWFSNQHKNELSDYCCYFLRDNIQHIDGVTLDYLRNLIKCKASLLCRFKVVFSSLTNVRNKEAQKSFKIRVLLGVI